MIVVSRDQFGAKEQAYPRQDLLHRRGTHRWVGKLHEQTEGPPGEVRADIEVEQLERPGGDRPHGDTFELLRSELAESGDPWHERHLFYLAREYAGHGLACEAVALIEMLIQHKSPNTGYPIQSSHACLIAGEITNQRGDFEAARHWYLRAVQEWAAWAEPHYALGLLCYSVAMKHIEHSDAADVIQALFEEAVGWLMAAAQYQPPAYFTDLTLYSWRRYEALSVCLARVGRNAEAIIWLQRAIAGCPQHDGLRQRLVEWTKEAA